MHDQTKIKVYQKLTTYTPDEFGTFCLLHFETVYRSLSPAQAHEAKLLALLDYCLRKPEELVRLTTLLFAETEGHVQPPQNIPTYQLTLKHFFDLRNLVNNCYQYCDNTGGVLVFALYEHSQQLLDCLRKRLIESLGPAKFATEYTTVNLSFKNTKAQLAQVRKLKNVLQGASVALSFIVADQATFDQLWTVLKEDLGNVLNHRCIVFVGLMTECTLPQDVIQLTAQPVSKYDIVDWVTGIGKSYSFSDDIIDFWKEVMWYECHTDNEVDIDLVYAHMDFAIRTLHDGPTVFHEKLRGRYHGDNT